MVPGIDLLAWNHWRAPLREGDASRKSTARAKPGCLLDTRHFKYLIDARTDVYPLTLNDS